MTPPALAAAILPSHHLLTISKTLTLTLIMDAEQEAAASIFAWVRSWFTPTVLFLLLNLIVGTIFTTSYAFSKNQRQDEEEHQHQEPPPTVLSRLRSIGSLYRYRSGEIALPGPPEASFDDVPVLDRDRDHQSGWSQPETRPPPPPPPTVLSRLRSIGSLYRYRSGEIALPGPPEASFDDVSALDRDRDHQSGWSQPETRPPPPPPPTVLSRLRSIGSLYRYRSDEIALPRPEAAADFVPPRDHQYGRSQSETHAPPQAAAAAEGKMAKSSSARAAVEEEKEEVDARADDFINRFRDQLRLQRLDSILRYKDMLSNGGR